MVKGIEVRYEYFFGVCLDDFIGSYVMGEKMEVEIGLEVVS